VASSREHYHVMGNTVEELARSLNFALSQIESRLDKQEGVRGIPKFESAVDMDSNQINQLAAPVVPSDAARKADAAGQDLETTDSPTFVGLTLTGTADANVYTVTDSNGTIIHQLGA